MLIKLAFSQHRLPALEDGVKWFTTKDLGSFMGPQGTHTQTPSSCVPEQAQGSTLVAKLAYFVHVTLTFIPVNMQHVKSHIQALVCLL